jgi:hypothetical protein
MKLPIQVAPVQRNFVSARSAMSGGIKPSANGGTCSCRGEWFQCVQNWNQCDPGWVAECSGNGFNCFCRCCNGSQCTAWQA